ncbi:MAG: hypothetical protein MJE77_09485 [Proteobacteria bacterium]|nr:hypothetical protein [Pseudomonadota bacterium]
MLLIALAVAALFHAGTLALVEHLRPEPLPRLVLKFKGKGTGSVVSQPAGLSCSKNCSIEFESGTEIKLVAVTEEGSTFEGWSEECKPREDWILECSLTLERDTVVQVGFGLVPERVDVAWVETEPAQADKELQITLPDPEIEAEFLTEPIEELLAAPEPDQPEPEIKPPTVAQNQARANPQPLNLRSVEVPDQNEVEEAPEDATHLSDKNRDVVEETRALDTNLEREQSGENTFSEKSDVTSEDVGAQEDDIAQLEDAEPTTLEDVEDEIRETGRDDQVIGAVVGEQSEDGEDGEDGDDRPSDKPGVLSMRGIDGRGSIVADDTKPGQGGKAGKHGKRGKWGIKTQLEFEDYERIVGKDRVKEELALGRNKRKSKRRGRWEKKIAAVKSALENFTPEVRPGNQTALKTRAAPFAVYIARMHRRIHELWGFGFLEDLDDKPSDHPLNNWELYTILEIVIDPDGSVVENKLRIVHHSGRLEFDVAAIDTIMTAGPYEPTPKKIRSPDGRVYMHWGFYRNHRQCGTFNAHPFILAEAPKDSRADTVGDADLVRNVPRRARRRQLERKPSGGSTGSASTPQLPSRDDPRAVHAANLWLSAFAQRNVAKMLKVTGAPFRSGGRVVANTVEEVGAVYKLVLQESRGRVRDMKVMSPAGYRKRFGALPSTIEDGKGLLLAVVRLGREQLTLVLDRQKDGEYKIVGLHR